MGEKRNSYITTRGKIVSALRSLWLRSRERSAALKRDKYTCQICGKKQSRKKGHECSVVVHHCAQEIDWEPIIEAVRAQLLINPDGLQTLCKECHGGCHGKKVSGS